jgi:chromosome segregation ATPase
MINPSITNAISQLGAATGNNIDWTSLWSILIVTAGAAFTITTSLIRIFGSQNSIKDEDIRTLPLVQEISDKTNKNSSQYSELKDTIAALRTDLEKLRTESAAGTRTLEELKKDYRDIVARLDDLLKNLLEWVSN